MAQLKDAARQEAGGIMLLIIIQKICQRIQGYIVLNNGSIAEKKEDIRNNTLSYLNFLKLK